MIEKLRRILIIGICLLLSLFQRVTFAENVTYNWNTVSMGGGGFMTGYLFHPAEEGLEYTRGDVGGIWRLEKTANKWISLSNRFGIDKANYYGGAGFAIDPQNPDVIYAAVGKTDALSGDVLKSTDRGITWESTGLNNAFSANGDSLKGFGECIAVDPVNSDIVYVATYNDGLYVSTNAGDSWVKETGLSVSDTAKYKVRCLLFDTSANSQGDNKTRRIYASVQSKGLYLSADGGENWELLAGSPENILRMDIASDGTLYAASQTGLFKYNGSVWTDCSYNNTAAEYRGVAVDPENSDFVVAVYMGDNIMRLPVIYSENGGKSWTNATERVNLVQNTLYLEENNFSSNTSFVEMDPFNPKHIVIGDWFGLWETEDITSPLIVTWEDKNEGIEQVCAKKIVTHPDNPYAALITAADNDGFPVENLEEKQPRKFSYVGSPYGGKRFMVSSDIDICEDAANYVVRIGLDSELKGVTSYSDDGGEYWKNFTVDPLSSGVPDERQWSKIRFSSNINAATGKPSSIVVIRDGEKSLYSKDFGETWNEINTLPKFDNSYLSACEYLDKDYVLDDTFYCFGSNGYLYRSTDGGEIWERRAYFNKYVNCELKAAPDMPGEVWLLNGKNVDFSGGVLYRSSDGLGSLRVVSSISNVVTFGFGKEAPGRLNPTVYAYGTVDGICGIYRSLDMGDTWDRIDDENLPVGNSPHGLSGSRKEFGTVFIATDGSGVFYGKTTDDDYALKPFTPEVFVPKNSVEVSLTGETSVINGSVQSGQSGERGTLMVFNPGYDVADFGADNAIQYQGEFVTGENGEFTVVVPLNLDAVEDDNSSAYYFKLYLDTPSFSNPETRTFHVEKKSFDAQTFYDYCWNGHADGWALDKGAAVADDSITVNNSSASLADLTWGNDIEIQCDPSSILYNTSSKFYVDFCGDDNFATRFYRLELQGRNTDSKRIAVLRDIVNGTTNAYINSDTSVAGNIFDEGTIKITCKDGVISAWWTMPSGTEYELFKDKSFDNKYTSGKIRFGCIGDATIKNIKINGDFTTSKGSSLCNGQVTATMKETTDVLKTVNFNGLVYEAASGATLSGKMNLNVPVRYAATSGSKDALVYAAYYDSNNDLISVDKFDVNVTADNTWKEAGEEVTLPDGTAKVRCFVWNTALVTGYNMSHAN